MANSMGTPGNKAHQYIVPRVKIRIIKNIMITLKIVIFYHREALSAVKNHYKN